MEGAGILHICPFGQFYCYLVYFVVIRYISWLFGISFPRFGILYQETSGNPGQTRSRKVRCRS
jgi:hypothetical protein